MTWKEFKEAVEARGVKDEDELWYIDVHTLGLKAKDAKDIEVDQEIGKLGWAI